MNFILAKITIFQLPSGGFCSSAKQGFCVKIMECVSKVYKINTFENPCFCKAQLFVVIILTCVQCFSPLIIFHVYTRYKIVRVAFHNNRCTIYKH